MDDLTDLLMQSPLLLDAKKAHVRDAIAARDSLSFFTSIAHNLASAQKVLEF